MKTKDSKAARRSFALCIFSFTFVLSLFAASSELERAMMCALMRMELSEQVVAEAQKLSGLEEVSAAAERCKGQIVAVAREKLLAAFPSADKVRGTFAAFVDAVNSDAAGYAPLRAEVAKGELVQDFAVAGKFLGDVQSWLRLREKGEKLPQIGRAHV